MAYYSVTHDYVQMPPFESFRDAESYYATLAHEATHSTRHPSRLNRGEPVSIVDFPINRENTGYILENRPGTASHVAAFSRKIRSLGS